MTEMVYGTTPLRVEDPILPRWWRTIDKMTLTAVLLLMAVGICWGLPHRRRWRSATGWSRSTTCNAGCSGGLASRRCC